MNASFPAIVAALEDALARPLPAAAAHTALAPRPRRQWPNGFDRGRIRDAAGLLLLTPIDDRAHVVLTVRARTLGRHGGQVSLPGGVIEPGEAHETAALREANEEVGLERADVRILGRLTAIEIPVSGFRLHPVVGAASRRPSFQPADAEVAQILLVAIDELMSPACLQAIDRSREGQAIVAPTFCVAGHEIWGATAMVLAELLVLLGWQPPPTERN
jgi:8-oxo-dGTP pyrophosphatase MutT (NUDIX family)